MKWIPIEDLNWKQKTTIKSFAYGLYFPNKIISSSGGKWICFDISKCCHFQNIYIVIFPISLYGHRICYENNCIVNSCSFDILQLLELTYLRTQLPEIIFLSPNQSKINSITLIMFRILQLRVCNCVNTFTYHIYVCVNMFSFFFSYIFGWIFSG